MFDVPMGCYDGADVRELVGLFILSKLSSEYPNDSIGWYRDDGLAVFKNMNTRSADKAWKVFCKILGDLGLEELELRNFVERMIWPRTEDIVVLQFATTSISWEYVDNMCRRNHWGKLPVVNIAKLAIFKFQVSTTLANLLELNVCESGFNDHYLLEVSKTCKTVRTLNV